MSQQLPKQHQTSPRSDGNTSLGKRILARIADYYFEWIGLKSMGDVVIIENREPDAVEPRQPVVGADP